MLSLSRRTIVVYVGSGRPGYRATDHQGDLENSFTKDDLLTNVMIYWVTETMPSSVRIYYESGHNQPRPTSMTPFQGSGKPSPIGFALFPKEINVPPRAWVERATRECRGALAFSELGVENLIRDEGIRNRGFRDAASVARSRQGRFSLLKRHRLC
jgi:hypothetical protein